MVDMTFNVPTRMMNVIRECEERWPQFSFAINLEVWSFNHIEDRGRQGRYRLWVSTAVQSGFDVHCHNPDMLVELIAVQIAMRVTNLNNPPVDENMPEEVIEKVSKENLVE